MEREPEKKTEPVVAPPPPVTPAPASNVYLPPGLRNPQQQQQPSQPRNLRSKAAPDIHNEEYFPSLATSKADQRKLVFYKSEDLLNVISIYF